MAFRRSLDAADSGQKIVPNELIEVLTSHFALLGCLYFNEGVINNDVTMDGQAHVMSLDGATARAVSQAGNASGNAASSAIKSGFASVQRPS